MSIMSVIGTARQGSRVITSLKRLSKKAKDALPYKEGGAPGLSLDDAKKQLMIDKVNIEKLQYADVFYAEINRMAPYYDLEKAKTINSMLSSISIVHDGLETQEDKVGSGYFNWHVGAQSGEIQATFHEFEGGDVVDFLTKVSSQNALGGIANDFGAGTTLNAVGSTVDKVNSMLHQAGNISKRITGSDITGGLDLGGISSLLGGGSSSGGGIGSGKDGAIMPGDGTFLLPYQYYFEIKISHIVSDPNTGMAYRKIIIEDDYLLDGSPSQEYSTGDERYLEVSGTFKPIKSWA
ncbi:hypothetical protein [Sulfurovum sp.]|uniref:hypothetical protein n=1 Tax=Sulfurovum sp. TaxID=1969726 RepID=UPI0025F60BE7|nr:hypothetical protein [Sulfurovum sp.]